VETNVQYKVGVCSRYFRRLDFMDDRRRIANLHRDIDDMPVVGEIDRLLAAAFAFNSARCSVSACPIIGEANALPGLARALVWYHQRAN
jgi:hypothetical protein